MKALRTLALAYLYYPHLWMMRLIGPYGAVVVARALAWLHWLGTFFGVDRATKKALRAAASQLLVASGPSTILRRHLEVKYQNFCEWHLYPTRRGRRYVERTYQVFDGLEHLESARAQGKGVILLVFHFGLVKMAFPALLAHGYRVQQHVFRGATYAGHRGHEKVGQDGAIHRAAGDLPSTTDHTGEADALSGTR
jgi:lauroyl/myristoyl acyltransferase